MISKDLDKDQELKEEVLLEMMVKHFNKSKLEHSIDKKVTIWIFLYGEY